MTSLAYAMGSTPGASGAPGGGDWGFIITMVVIFVIFFLLRSQQKIRISGPSLVLIKFNLDESASDNPILDIEGRSSGLIAWLMTILGLDTKTTLRIMNREVSFRSSSLFGEIHQVAQLSSISSTHCGLFKPLGYLIVGIVIALGGVVAGLAGLGQAMLPLIVLGFVFIVAYFLSKKLAISLETNGGMLMGLIFKRSVIENIPVDVKKALLAIQLINRKVGEAQMRII